MEKLLFSSNTTYLRTLKSLAISNCCEIFPLSEDYKTATQSGSVQIFSYSEQNMFHTELQHMAQGGDSPMFLEKDHTPPSDPLQASLAEGAQVGRDGYGALAVGSTFEWEGF